MAVLIRGLLPELLTVATSPKLELWTLASDTDWLFNTCASNPGNVRSYWPEFAVCVTVGVPPTRLKNCLTVPSDFGRAGSAPREWAPLRRSQLVQELFQRRLGQPRMGPRVLGGDRDRRAEPLLR